MEEAAKRAFIFVTATGCEKVLTQEHFNVMRDDVILCNMSHCDTEIDVKWLDSNYLTKVHIRPQVGS